MTAPPRPASALRDFLDSEAAGGILLMVAAAIAMLIANSPFGAEYFHALHIVTGPQLSNAIGPMTVHLWINDGLMALFFLFVGLEIKRELIDGRLATWPQRRLPVLAAASGMAVPALIFAITIGWRADLLHGWAIPSATDIAFAMGVMALLGNRVPASLKLFLVTVAIVDDMGAVAIIALFYSGGLNFLALFAAAMIFAAMWLMNHQGVKTLTPYLVGFILLWYAVLCSGVHATIAGVLAALTVPIIPTPGTPDASDSTLHQMEHLLAKPVSLCIVPLFGFANAGVVLGGPDAVPILSPLPLAVALGLFLGKQLGIFGAVFIAVRCKFAAMPMGSRWVHIYGTALLCGIGFTMSLFIGGLAYSLGELNEAAKIGTFVGSLASALLGYAVLRCAPVAAAVDVDAIEEGEVAWTESTG